MVFLILYKFYHRFLIRGSTLFFHKTVVIVSFVGSFSQIISVTLTRQERRLPKSTVCKPYFRMPFSKLKGVIIFHQKNICKKIILAILKRNYLISVFMVFSTVNEPGEKKSFYGIYNVKGS